MCLPLKRRMQGIGGEFNSLEKHNMLRSGNDMEFP